MKIERYNDCLLSPESDSTLNHIVARQLSAKHATPAEQSPLVTDSVFQICSTRVSSNDERMLVVDKIKDKWWGRQGRTPDVNRLTAILHSYINPDIKVKADVLRELALRPNVKPYIMALLAPWVTAVTSSRVVKPDSRCLVYIKPKEETNSGFFRFTSEGVREFSFLQDALESARLYARDIPRYPMIAWYRDMRQKLRVIFGDALPELIRYEKYLSTILRDAMYYVPSVEYHDRFRTAKQIEMFHRYNTKYVVMSCEGDYESMDTTITWALARTVFSTLVEIFPILENRLARSMHELHAYFRRPIVDFKGDVVVPDETALLSGISPTNGLENIINLFIQGIVIALIAENIEVHDFLLKVMGDDSAALLAVRSSDVDKLRDLFPQVFAEVSALAGLRVNLPKQRVSAESVFFTKHFYPLASRKGYRLFDDADGKAFPYPLYLAEFTANSLRNPERGPLYYKGDDTLSPEDALLIGECQRIASVMDNSYGDKGLWGSLATHVVQHIGKDTLAACLAYPTKLRSTWREKVYGQNGKWSKSSSPFYRFISR